MKQAQSTVCQCCVITCCVLPSSDQKPHHISVRHPGHCRGHLLPCAVRQNDLCALTDQGCTSQKQRKSHRAAFCWEHRILLGTLLLCIFPQGAVWVEHTLLYVSQYFSNQLHTISFKGLFTCPKTSQKPWFSHF